MSEEEMVPRPLHPIEITIHIGAEDLTYAALVLQELYDRAKNSLLNNCCSGGGGGCYSVTLVKRNITSEQFREELQKWNERH